MAKQEFIEKKLSRASQKKLAIINAIIEEYSSQGFKMNVRSVYYQMVARGYIANNIKEYKKISNLLTNAREGGLADWDAIEDRGRTVVIPQGFNGIQEILDAAANSYRIDLMAGQEYYIELWCEKVALASVLEPIADKYHIPFLANKGFGSASSMYEAYNRFKNRSEQQVIIYVGDHDPSGLAMVCDIKNRMCEVFGLRHLFVLNPALTLEQVRKYNLPPNKIEAKPKSEDVKRGNPNKKRYEAEFGTDYWELDALSPVVLHEIVETQILDLIDMNLYKYQLQKQASEKAIIQQIADNY
jgi:hypothetical protein